MFKIGESCECCGTCVEFCIMEAISLGNNHYEINNDICVECGKCVIVCPISAISEA